MDIDEIGGVQMEISKVPKFLRRLYRAVDDPSVPYIGWSIQGDRINITDKNQFTQHILPTLSKTREYSAFIRQLNIYGFIKIKADKNGNSEEYYCPYFKKGEPESLRYMKRVKKPHNSDKYLYGSHIENTIDYLTSSNYRMNSEIIQLKERVDRQERTINGLLDILGRVFRSGAQNFSYDTAQFVPNVGRNDELILIGDRMLNASSSKAEGDSIPSPIALPKKDKEDESKLPDMSSIFF